MKKEKNFKVVRNYGHLELQIKGARMSGFHKTQKGLPPRKQKGGKNSIYKDW